MYSVLCSLTHPIVILMFGIKNRIIFYVIWLIFFILTARLFTNNCQLCSEQQKWRKSLGNIPILSNDNMVFLQKQHTQFSFDNVQKNHDGSLNIEKILNKARTKIKTELQNYNFANSEAQKLEDLLTESGGRPVRNIIVSTWRSGSTYFGDLINAVPSNFYHYEPLFKYKVKQIRGPPNAKRAKSELKKILKCDYRGLEDYFEYGKNHIMHMNQFKYNSRLWDQCVSYNTELCFDADFTSAFCKLFPFQSMKLVRFRLHLIKELLDDKELNVKVVLLVRDPRGVMQSRRHNEFCMEAPDCSKPELLCSDLVRDYLAAKRLMQKYPGKIMVLRFEDLALNLNTITQELFKFLRLGVTQPVLDFIATHGNVNNTDSFSTFKVTKDIPFKWKKILDFDYVQDIQESCKEAMKLWGYNPAQNASHMVSDDFYPLRSYSVVDYGD